MKNGAEPGEILREIRYEDVASVRIGRAEAERLDGRPTLVVERRSADPVRIASVAQAGIVSELAERLAALILGGQGMSRVAVIVPLKEGSRDSVRDLLEPGPPFDPAQAGLERHDVFLTEREAVFVFESETRSAIERLVADSSLWAAAAAWQEHVAGPPRLGEDAYAWARPKPPEYVSFGSTPGPGDSEGGDVFTP